MGSLIVPLGSDPFNPNVYFSNQLVETHFSSGSGNRMSAGVSASVAANAAVTGAGALSSDDTATYASLNLAGWSSAQPTAALGVGMSAHARQDEAETIPEGATAITAKLVAVAKSTTTTPTTRFTLFATAYDDAGADLGMTLPAMPSFARTLDWTRYQATISSSLLTTVAEWRAILEARALRGVFEVLPEPGTYADGETLLAYLAAEFTWTDPEPSATAYGIPALRQVQRGDGHGMSGAPRAIQHGSVQGSLRQIGFQ